MSYTSLVNPKDVQSGNADSVETVLAAEVAANAPQQGAPDNSGQPAGHEPQNGDPRAGTQFEGKSMGEIIESYRNLHSAFGRQSNDLGVQRRLTDQLLDLKRTDDLAQNSPATTAEPIQVDSGQLLEDPTATFDRVLAERDKRNQEALDTRLAQMEDAMMQTSFINKHPDYDQISQDPNFVQWIQSDQLRQRAANSVLSGDWQTADLLVTQYKSTRADQEAAKANAEQTTHQAVNAASLENSASVQTPESGNIITRADLMKMRIEKPEVYHDPAYQSVIMKAYAEGRVR